MSNQTTVFYVALNGKDAWSGRLAEPNDARDDGPFATLPHALKAVAEAKRRGEDARQSGVTIYLRGGNYFQSEPIVLTPEHSGAWGRPVTVAAYQDEKPILSGGRKIEGWEQVEVGGRALWAARISEVERGEWFFRELWVDDRRALRARHPNRGYFGVAEVIDLEPEQPWWQPGPKHFRFHEGDLQSWPTITEGEIIAMNRWVDSHLPITGVDEAENVISFSKLPVHQLVEGDLYYIEHCLEVLDEPGEWFLDKKEGILYYLPRPGEDMAEAEVIAPVLAQVVRMTGEPLADEWVEHIIWRGVTFAHTEWWFPPDYTAGWPDPFGPGFLADGFRQAAAGVPGAVYGEGVRDCTLAGCTITQVGTYGIELGRGCKDNRILGCTLTDLGAGGIKIGETAIRDELAEQTWGNAVADCTIRDGGKVFPSAVGILIGQSPHNHVHHNEIADFYYSGISIGWTWGGLIYHGRSLAGGNHIEWNHIHHIGQKSDGDGPILGDMGGIYTLGMQGGTVIRHNLVHDVAGFGYGGRGIYLDEGSMGILVENNTVTNTSHDTFFQHRGLVNTVRNNIFAWGRDFQVGMNRGDVEGEDHLLKRIWFEGNIVIGETEHMLTMRNATVTFNLVYDNNVYWREGGGPVTLFDLDWQAWQAKGLDPNSIIADPLFVDASRYDFHLLPESPALNLGFNPFDLSGVGPRLDGGYEHEY